jgi:excisionase family DNA binding protein
MLNVLTITEAAPLLGYSRAHVVRLCEQGKIPARKTGKVWLIHVDDVQAYGRKRPIIR